MAKKPQELSLNSEMLNGACLDLNQGRYAQKSISLGDEVMIIGGYSDDNK